MADDDESPAVKRLMNEYHAWHEVVRELRNVGAGDISWPANEKLYDAITLWGEELAQLRIAGPGSAVKALNQRRTKWSLWEEK